MNDTLMARLFAKVEQSNGCWVWTAFRTKDGYGRIGVGSRTDGSRRCALAHRVTFELFIGPIPDGREIDHLCRNRACVNPTHLEAVSHHENVLRGELGRVMSVFQRGRKKSIETLLKMRGQIRTAEQRARMSQGWAVRRALIVINSREHAA